MKICLLLIAHIAIAVHGNGIKSASHHSGVKTGIAGASFLPSPVTAGRNVAVAPRPTVVLTQPRPAIINQQRPVIVNQQPQFVRNAIRFNRIPLTFARQAQPFALSGLQGPGPQVIRLAQPQISLAPQVTVARPQVIAPRPQVIVQRPQQVTVSQPKTHYNYGQSYGKSYGGAPAQQQGRVVIREGIPNIGGIPLSRGNLGGTRVINGGNLGGLAPNNGNFGLRGNVRLGPSITNGGFSQEQIQQLLRGQPVFTTVSLGNSVPSVGQAGQLVGRSNPGSVSVLRPQTSLVGNIPATLTLNRPQTTILSRPVSGSVVVNRPQTSSIRLVAPKPVVRPSVVSVAPRPTITTGVASAAVQPLEQKDISSNAPNALRIISAPKIRPAVSSIRTINTPSISSTPLRTNAIRLVAPRTTGTVQQVSVASPSRPATPGVFRLGSANVGTQPASFGNRLVLSNQVNPSIIKILSSNGGNLVSGSDLLQRLGAGRRVIITGSSLQNMEKDQLQHILTNGQSLAGERYVLVPETQTNTLGTVFTGPSSDQIVRTSSAGSSLPGIARIHSINSPLVNAPSPAPARIPTVGVRGPSVSNNNFEEQEEQEEEEEEEDPEFDEGFASSSQFGVKN